MTGAIGSNDFAIRIEKQGGIKRLARTIYARNMWEIMKTFKSFPSADGTFATMTSLTRDFIYEELAIDQQESENAAKGLETKPDSQYYDPDASWWDDPDKLFDGMDTDPDKLNKELAEMLDDHTKEIMYDRVKDTVKRVANGKDNKQAADHEEEVHKVMTNRILNMQNALNRYYQGDTKALNQYKNTLHAKGSDAISSTPTEQSGTLASKDESDKNKQTRHKMAEKVMKNTLNMLNGE